MDQEKMNTPKAYLMARRIVATEHKKLTNKYLDAKSIVCRLEGDSFYGEIPEKIHIAINNLVREEMMDVASFLIDPDVLKSVKEKTK